MFVRVFGKQRSARKTQAWPFESCALHPQRLSKSAVSVREIGLHSGCFLRISIALGVHAPVIRCSLLSAQGQWSEILGSLLLLECADSRLMLIGTQRGATPTMCVCVRQYIKWKTSNTHAYTYTCMHTYYCACSHAMSHLTASLNGSVKHSRESVTSSPPSSHLVCVFYVQKEREYSSIWMCVCVLMPHECGMRECQAYTDLMHGVCVCVRDAQMYSGSHVECHVLKTQADRCSLVSSNSLTVSLTSQPWGVCETDGGVSSSLRICQHSPPKYTLAHHHSQHPEVLVLPLHQYLDCLKAVTPITGSDV